MWCRCAERRDPGVDSWCVFNTLWDSRGRWWWWWEKLVRDHYRCTHESPCQVWSADTCRTFLIAAPLARFVFTSFARVLIRSAQNRLQVAFSRLIIPICLFFLERSLWVCVMCVCAREIICCKLELWILIVLQVFYSAEMTNKLYIRINRKIRKYQLIF